jgi:hypothetical protein
MGHVVVKAALPVRRGLWNEETKEEKWHPMLGAPLNNTRRA